MRLANMYPIKLLSPFFVSLNENMHTVRFASCVHMYMWIKGMGEARNHGTDP